MAQKIKSKNAKIKDLLREIRYHQTMNRVDEQSLRLGREKVRQLARELKELKK